MGSASKLEIESRRPGSRFTVFSVAKALWSSFCSVLCSVLALFKPLKAVFLPYKLLFFIVSVCTFPAEILHERLGYWTEMDVHPTSSLATLQWYLRPWNFRKAPFLKKEAVKKTEKAKWNFSLNLQPVVYKASES